MSIAKLATVEQNILDEFLEDNDAFNRIFKPRNLIFYLTKIFVKAQMLIFLYKLDFKSLVFFQTTRLFFWLTLKWNASLQVICAFSFSIHIQKHLTVFYFFLQFVLRSREKATNYERIVEK